MKHTKTFFAAAATALILGVAFAPAASATPTDACTLLTQAQVAAVLGVAVEAGTHPVATALTFCGWAPPGGPQIDGKRVTTGIKTLKSFTLGKTPMKGITKTPVNGTGDDAYYVTAGGFGTTLNVAKGDASFSVSVGGKFTLNEIKSIEKTLADQILAKF